MAQVKPYFYKVLEFSNYDGDSFRLTLDLGFSLSLHQQCRLMGCDTPELRGGTEESKKAGYLARDKVRQWCEEARTYNEALYFHSENLDGKFGRPLGDLVRQLVFLGADDKDHVLSKSLREYLINNNYGVPYDGQAKSEIQATHERNFEILRERGEI